MEWIDVGANLTHESFAIDRAAVIERAQAVQVSQMIVTGADLDSSRQAIELAQHRPQRLFATAGVHPHHAEQLQLRDLPALRTLLSAPQVVAAGECGLDYYRDLSPRSAQRRAFEWQLQLAAECGKPVFLHQREAHDDLMAVLRVHRAAISGGIAHCFTGDERELEDYLSLDLSIGITGWINDERRGAHLLELVRRIPADKLMLETDAPYLMPRDLAPKPKSRRNEPMYLPQVAARVAQARAQSLDSLAALSTANARALFRLPSPS